MSAAGEGLPEPPGVRAAGALGDGWIVAKRNLIKIKRIPDLLIFSTIQPIMFVLLFAYVFGGSIQIPGVSYRFRSLPMSRAAVLIGRTTSDLLNNVFVVFVMSVTGLIVGWRIHTGVLDGYPR